LRRPHGKAAAGRIPWLAPAEHGAVHADAVSVAVTASFAAPLRKIAIEFATMTTILLPLVGTPVAWWLARTRHGAKGAVAAVVTLPLVLPPTVLGFHLLVLLEPDGPIGRLLQPSGRQLLPFTFAGLVVASVIYSLPFVVQPACWPFPSSSCGRP